MSFGDPGDRPHRIPGNPDPAMLGGDNSSGDTPFAAPGNPDKSTLSAELGWPGGTVVVSGAPTAEQVRRMFRDSDTLGMDGRIGGH